MNPDDLFDREPPRDPATLLPYANDIVLEEGYVFPATHSQNDPSRAPLQSRFPKSGHISRI